MDQFDNRLDKFIASKFKKLFPAEDDQGAQCLYHYTTIGAFEILSQSDTDLLLTKCSALNDDAEFSLGIKVVLDYFKRYKDMSLGVTEEIITDFKNYPECLPWIFSLSRESDSLYQWIAYTDKHSGGANIGIDFNNLMQLVQENNRATAKNIESLMFLSPCFYVKDTFSNETDTLIKFVFGEYRNKLFTHYDESDSIMAKADYYKYITIFLTFLVASVIKDMSFHYENEWRIVSIPSTEDFKSRFVVLGDKPRIRSGIFGKCSKFSDLWRSVMVSPHGVNLDLVEMIVKAREIGCKVRKSTITYNGR